MGWDGIDSRRDEEREEKRRCCAAAKRCEDTTNCNVHTIYYPYFSSGAARRVGTGRDGLLIRLPLQFVSLPSAALAHSEIFDFLEQKPHLYLLNYNYLALVSCGATRRDAMRRDGDCEPTAALDGTGGDGLRLMAPERQSLSSRRAARRRAQRLPQAQARATRLCAKVLRQRRFSALH